MSRRLIGPASGVGLAALATSVVTGVTALTAGGAAASTHGNGPPATTTPIKHVIVIIGENHSFDNVFATYHPPRGQHVMNLLSEGIITKNGGLGPKWKQAQQLTATNTGTYSLTPKTTGAYPTLPRPNTTYVSSACDGQKGNSPDTRFPANLVNAPFQITKYVPYFDTHSEYSSLGFGQCEFYGA